MSRAARLGAMWSGSGGTPKYGVYLEQDVGSGQFDQYPDMFFGMFSPGEQVNMPYLLTDAYYGGGEYYFNFVYKLATGDTVSTSNPFTMPAFDVVVVYNYDL